MKALTPLQKHPFVCLVLAIAFFIPQTFFLPTLPYSFLALGVVWVLLIRRFKRLSIIAGLCLLAVLILSILLSERWVSYLYFLSSLSLLMLTGTIVRNFPTELMVAARLYLIVSLLVVLLGAAAFVAGLQIGIIFEDVSGVTRARGLNEEPNMMGFSLVVIYTLFLFHDSWRAGAFIVAVIWCLALASFSIFAIGSLFIITLVHILWKRKFARLIWLFLLFFPVALLNIDRIEAIVQGIDNSTNFRTWGAITVAYFVQQEDCGFFGCGIGSMRSVLQGHPLMDKFSGFDVLPNFIATVLLELGPLGVVMVFGLIFVAAFGNPLRWNKNLGFSAASFYCLTSYALSGSYFYDPHFWSAMGLFATLHRSNVFHSQSHVPWKVNTLGKADCIT